MLEISIQTWVLEMWSEATEFHNKLYHVVIKVYMCLCFFLYLPNTLLFIVIVTAATQSQNTGGGFGLKDRLKKAPTGGGNM